MCQSQQGSLPQSHGYWKRRACIRDKGQFLTHSKLVARGIFMALVPQSLYPEDQKMTWPGVSLQEKLTELRDVEPLIAGSEQTCP